MCIVCLGSAPVTPWMSAAIIAQPMWKGSTPGPAFRSVAIAIWSIRHCEPAACIPGPIRGHYAVFPDSTPGPAFVLIDLYVLLFSLLVREILGTVKSERKLLGRNQKKPTSMVLATFCFSHLSNNCSEELFKPRCGSLLFA